MAVRVSVDNFRASRDRPDVRVDGGQAGGVIRRLHDRAPTPAEHAGYRVGGRGLLVAGPVSGAANPRSTPSTMLLANSIVSSPPNIRRK